MVIGSVKIVDVISLLQKVQKSMEAFEKRAKLLRLYKLFFAERKIGHKKIENAGNIYKSLFR